MEVGRRCKRGGSRSATSQREPALRAIKNREAVVHVLRVPLLNPRLRDAVSCPASSFNQGIGRPLSELLRSNGKTIHLPCSHNYHHKSTYKNKRKKKITLMDKSNCVRMPQSKFLECARNAIQSSVNVYETSSALSLVYRCLTPSCALPLNNVYLRQRTAVGTHKI